MTREEFEKAMHTPWMSCPHGDGWGEISKNKFRHRDVLRAIRACGELLWELNEKMTACHQDVLWEFKERAGSGGGKD